jgi:Flp pilus assembly pilin Flp
MRFLQRWIRCERGQDLIEYAVLAALIAIVAAGAAGALGNLLNSVFWQAIGPSI